MRLRRLKNRAALLTLALVAAVAPQPAIGGARTAGPPVRLVDHVKRAVVVVNSYDERGRLLSQGSGFFVRQTQITTNLHVVGRAARVEVVTFGGRVRAVEGGCDAGVGRYGPRVKAESEVEAGRKDVQNGGVNGDED